MIHRIAVSSPLAACSQQIVGVFQRLRGRVVVSMRKARESGSFGPAFLFAVGAYIICHYMCGRMKRYEEQHYYQGLLTSLLDFQHAQSGEKP